ncbi:MAG TPA: hypothetical protein PKA43_00255 [Candidatus Competibacter phosphatis]|nr:hypothetical protein [Candidatus Competibacter phosphatis]
MTQEQIKQEIALVMDDMRTAHDWRREYLIGELKALLWVQGGGDVLRPVAFQQAVAAWDEMREGGQP